MVVDNQKRNGAFYTPVSIADTLVKWVVQRDSDRLLDPACGDGRFLASHSNAVGVERDPAAIVAATRRAPHAMIHAADFFEWAGNTHERFDCAAGNPPFIRYQHFSGQVRQRALELCARQDVGFSALTSSWAPFLVAAASLLKPGGRLGFVVPAEIGHATYAAPLLEFLARRFAHVQVVAVQNKLFPQLSEDAWFLYADGFGGSTSRFLLSQVDVFKPTSPPPSKGNCVTLSSWRLRNCRLRPFLLSTELLQLYDRVAGHPRSKRLSDVARVGIGYVTGANSFFHLRPSAAKSAGIPRRFLLPTVRSARFLPPKVLNRSTVNDWLRNDEQALLLRLQEEKDLPASVVKYLSSKEALTARAAYKCRNRNPWFVVPDIRIPDAFLSYMSGLGPILVANEARCTCSNAVHAVELKNGSRISQIQLRWARPICRLSCELEGHPLGGGMLKLEPREAARVVLPPRSHKLTASEGQLIEQGLVTARRWRHYG